MDFMTFDHKAHHASLASADFEGAAKLFFTQADMDRLQRIGRANPEVLDMASMEKAFVGNQVNISLLITEASYSLADSHQINELIGNNFGISYYGRSPMILAVAGVLFDDYRQQNKKLLMALYKNVLRLSQVAAIGAMPNIEFLQCIVQGAFLNLGLSENSSAADQISVNFQMLVFNMYKFDPRNTGSKSAMVSFNERLHLTPEQLKAVVESRHKQES